MVRPAAAWFLAGLLLTVICRNVAAGSQPQIADFDTSTELGAEADVGYTKAQTYNAALRYLRVDLAYEVTEKDASAAYLLFRFVPTGSKAATNGAIEIIEQHDAVRVIVRLSALPQYQEQMLRDGLQRKLREEYGEPPPPREEPPPPDKHRDHKDSPDGGS